MKIEQRVKEDSLVFADKVANEGINPTIFVNELHKGNLFIITKETKDNIFSNSRSSTIEDRNGDFCIITIKDLPGKSLNNFIVGPPCRQKNHDYEGYKINFYYKHGNGSRGACAACSKAKGKIYPQKEWTGLMVDEHPTNINADRNVIAFLADVLAGYKGNPFYNAERDIKKLRLTKMKCPNGHNVEGTGFTLRYKSGGLCLHCEIDAAFMKRNKKKKRLGNEVVEKNRHSIVGKGLERFGNVFRQKLKSGV